MNDDAKRQELYNLLKGYLDLDDKNHMAAQQSIDFMLNKIKNDSEMNRIFNETIETASLTLQAPIVKESEMQPKICSSMNSHDFTPPLKNSDLNILRSVGQIMEYDATKRVGQTNTGAEYISYIIYNEDKINEFNNILSASLENTPSYSAKLIDLYNAYMQYAPVIDGEVIQQFENKGVDVTNIENLNGFFKRLTLSPKDLECLEAKGLDVNQRTHNGESMLLSYMRNALQNDDMGVIKINPNVVSLMVDKYGLSITDIDQDMHSILYNINPKTNIGKDQLTLLKEFGINERDEYGMTLLDYTVDAMTDHVKIDIYGYYSENFSSQQVVELSQNGIDVDKNRILKLLLQEMEQQKMLNEMDASSFYYYKYTIMGLDKNQLTDANIALSNQLNGRYQEVFDMIPKADEVEIPQPDSIQTELNHEDNEYETPGSR